LSGKFLREEANNRSKRGSIASLSATLLREEADIGSKRASFVSEQASSPSE